MQVMKLSERDRARISAQVSRIRSWALSVGCWFTLREAQEELERQICFPKPRSLRSSAISRNQTRESFAAKKKNATAGAVCGSTVCDQLRTTRPRAQRT